MSDLPGGMMIAVHEARTACKGEPDLTLRIEKAMKAVHNHWMETNQDNQFKSAVIAVMSESPDEAEKDRVLRSFQALSRMGAMLQALQNGVPVDFDAMAEKKTDEDLIPLMPMWRKIAA